MAEISEGTLTATAEALCNLWGDDPNDPDAWSEAYAYAPEYVRTHPADFPA